MGKFLIGFLVVLGVVVVFGVLYLPLEQRLRNTFWSWTADLPEIGFDFGKVTFVFPWGLEFEDLHLAGKDFSLHFPKAFLRLHLLSWLGFKEGPVFQVFADQVRFQAVDWGFLQSLSDLDFHKIPSFSLQAQEWVLENKPGFSFEKVAFSKGAEGFTFSGYRNGAEISGHLDLDRTLVITFDFPFQDKRWIGELSCFLKDGVLQGHLKSPFEISWKSSFNFDGTENALLLKAISLRDVEGLFAFQGQGKISFSENLGLVVGKLKGWKDKVLELSLQTFFDKEPWRAFLSLREDSTHTLLKSELLNQKGGKVSFEIQAGSLLQGMSVSGGGWLALEGGKLVLELSRVACSLSNNPFWSELSGEGKLQGSLQFGEKGLERGHLFFTSEELIFKEWQLKQPLLELELAANGTAFLSGEATLLGGKVQLEGVWSEGAFKGQGKFSGIALEGLVANWKNLPLSGTLEGKMDIRGEKSELRFEFLLEGGEIFWGSSHLAKVSEGRLLLRNVDDLEAQVSLEGKEGKAEAFLTQKEKRLEVTLRLEDFLWEGKQNGYELAFQVSGDLKLKKSEEEQAFQVALHAPLWRWAGFEGENLVFEGLLEENRLEVQKLETAISDLGRLRLSGWLIPFQEAFLEGEIARVKLPENRFALQGELEKGSLSIAGPWEGVKLALQGEGKNLFLRGRQLGKSFEVLFEGKLKLPGKGENLPFTSYLDPENWDKGFLRIEDIDLRSLGIPLLERYQIESSGDLLLELDNAKKVWLLGIRGITFAYPELPLLSGELEGEFDGQKMLIKKLFLEDTEHKIQLNLGGKLDLENNLMDVTGFLKVNPFLDLSWRDFVLCLHGEGEVRFWGELTKPHAQGRIFLQEAKVLQAGRELVSLGSVSGEISEDKLRILEGKIALSKIKGVFGGELTQQSMDLKLSFSGDCSQLGFGEALTGQFEGEANLSGSWKRPFLKGSLLVDGGKWDYAHQNQSSLGSKVFALEEMEKRFSDLPLDLELELKTSSEPFLVRTRFMEVTLAGSLLLRVEEGKSSLSGTLQVVDGSYNLVTRKIPLSGKVYFGELFGLEPQLDLYGLCEVDGYEIKLMAQGPLNEYRLELISEPALSREEILSLLFTGDRNAYLSLSDINIGPLFWGVFSFLTGGKGNFLEDLSNFGDLRVNPIFSHGSWLYELTLEKRLGNNLVIGYTQNLSGEDRSAVYFNCNINENWSFKAEVDEKKGWSWELEFTTRF